MKFLQTALDGAFVVEPELLEDDRGFFARTFCRDAFAAAGLVTEFVQCSVSHNRRRGTLRGMHYQAAPHEETKLVRCTQGSVFDVIIDIRPESSTFTRWHAEELSAANHRMLYIPAGFAHGFLTLEDDTELFYQISTPYHPGSARGVRWDDPAFAIQWPAASEVISDRDAAYPDFLART